MLCWSLLVVPPPLGGFHPHVVCLTSSPLSSKHCCCAAFKSAGNVMKVCIHSFSFSPLQFICILLLAVTDFRIINSLCCLIAFVGNWGWYQNNQISLSFTADQCALLWQPSKAPPGFYERTNYFEIDIVHYVHFVSFSFFVQENGVDPFIQLDCAQDTLLCLYCLLCAWCLIAWRSIYTPCYPWMKLSWQQALSDASPGKNARPGPPQRAWP